VHCPVELTIPTSPSLSNAIGFSMQRLVWVIWVLQDGTLCVAPLSALIYHFDTRGPLPILPVLIIPHTTKRATPSSSSLGSDTSWHGGFFPVLRYLFSVSVNAFPQDICVCAASPSLLRSEWI